MNYMFRDINEHGRDYTGMSGVECSKLLIAFEWVHSVNYINKL